MKIKLVFDDWRKVGVAESVYNTELGIDLSLNDLHSGTTFDAELNISEDVEKDILKAWKDHKAYPVFSVLCDTEKK